MGKKYKYILTIQFEEGEDRLDFLKEEMELLSEVGFIEEIDLFELPDEEILELINETNVLGIS
jgi:hypothetical protein